MSNQFKTSSEIRNLHKSLLSWNVSFSGPFAVWSLESSDLFWEEFSSIQLFKLIFLIGYGTTIWDCLKNLKATGWASIREKKQNQCFWAHGVTRGRKRRAGQLWSHLHNGKNLQLQAIKSASQSGLKNRQTNHKGTLQFSCQKNLKFCDRILLSFLKCSFSKTQSMWEQCRGCQINWVILHTMKAATVTNFQCRVLLYMAQVITAGRLELRRCIDARSLGKKDVSFITAMLDIVIVLLSC